MPHTLVDIYHAANTIATKTWIIAKVLVSYDEIVGLLVKADDGVSLDSDAAPSPVS